jgi:hypothetical protein
VSIKHLQRYLNEFQFRFNNRQNEQIFEHVIINLVLNAGIRYKDLTGKNPSDMAKPEVNDDDLPF